MENVLVVIPARLKSTRFPNKPLHKINGREMILHVCDRVAPFYNCIVATPDHQIMDLVEQAGYKAIYTTECKTGTDRVAQVASMINADIYVNVQGDEPLVNIKDIEKVVNFKQIYYNTVVGSMTFMETNGPDIVKVFLSGGYLRNLTRKGTSVFRQCGIYAFNKEELEAFYNIDEQEKEAWLDAYEDIELMRFLELDIPVKMVDIKGSKAVDRLKDIQKIEEELQCHK